ncbi:Glyoxalase/bleomycin resistance protein/dioxygenase [Trichodesmium erythraeum IMS101]|uniref:Glyoxalase/bleomycin resistance protein/dioxygenase n=1 Tax=Trichodesmium erythraeum (strain IMS101) TaxID=203124 RepID=Q10YN8_TRIEI|nr:VOC family protein [Trichodesmium sp. ALOHA_ZT_67]MDE5093894.1 VOC family protein [Trichodesmium sp. St11_bin5]
MNQVLFHLAFPVNNITKTKEFYSNGLGCKVGRESRNSVILNLYGNQIVAHIAKETLEPQKGIYPRHFGLVFSLESDWEALLERAQKNKLKFYQQPKRRFTNSPLEHRTFFLEDPFYNLLEFKYYCHQEAIFGCNDHKEVGDIIAV